MKLDPTIYHRMRFEAALHFEATSPRLDDAGAWGSADAFLAAGGYECGEEAVKESLTTEPTEDDWFSAWLGTPNTVADPLREPHLLCREVSRRAHELARMRGQK